jgi:hypothetical protein
VVKLLSWTSGQTQVASGGATELFLGVWTAEQLDFYGAYNIKVRFDQWSKFDQLSKFDQWSNLWSNFDQWTAEQSTGGILRRERAESLPLRL